MSLYVSLSVLLHFLDLLRCVLVSVALYRYTEMLLAADDGKLADHVDHVAPSGSDHTSSGSPR